MPHPTIKHYNVLLAYPDYMTDGNLETYCAVGVPADTAAEAIRRAQLLAMVDNFQYDEAQLLAMGDNFQYDEAHPTDFAPLLVFHGMVNEEPWDAH